VVVKNAMNSRSDSKGRVQDATEIADPLAWRSIRGVTHERTTRITSAPGGPKGWLNVQLRKEGVGHRDETDMPQVKRKGNRGLGVMKGIDRLSLEVKRRSDHIYKQVKAPHWQLSYLQSTRQISYQDQTTIRIQQSTQLRSIKQPVCSLYSSLYLRSALQLTVYLPTKVSRNRSGSTSTSTTRHSPSLAGLITRNISTLRTGLS
jgi:hypothetical protein